MRSALGPAAILLIVLTILFTPSIASEARAAAERAGGLADVAQAVQADAGGTAHTMQGAGAGSAGD